MQSHLKWLELLSAQSRKALFKYAKTFTIYQIKIKKWEKECWLLESFAPKHSLDLE